MKLFCKIDILTALNSLSFRDQPQIRRVYGCIHKVCTRPRFDVIVNMGIHPAHNRSPFGNRYCVVCKTVRSWFKNTAL